MRPTKTAKKRMLITLTKRRAVFVLTKCFAGGFTPMDGNMIHYPNFHYLILIWWRDDVFFTLWVIPFLFLKSFWVYARVSIGNRVFSFLNRSRSNKIYQSVWLNYFTSRGKLSSLLHIDCNRSQAVLLHGPQVSNNQVWAVFLRESCISGQLVEARGSISLWQCYVTLLSAICS
jgi:hypothetical protein